VTPLRMGGLFSGIGGLELGLERSGVARTVWQCEIDPYCRTVLEKHWPNIPRYTDAADLPYPSLPPVDLLCGGFPCQDVSGAGKGAGLSGARSGLWYAFARAVDALQPEWVIVENVASGAARWVDAVCADLGRLGYACLPIPLEGHDVGAPHRRQRIFVVARRVGVTLPPRCERAEPERAAGRGGSSDTGAGLAARRLPDGDGIALRDDEQRRSARRPGSIRDARHAEPLDGLLALADGSRERPEHGTRPSGQRREAWHVANRCDARVAAHEWPPARNDLAGWERWIAAGGAEPGVLPGADGLPRAVARRRIAALGNAVVPACAEVIGCIIRELIEREERHL